MQRVCCFSVKKSLLQQVLSRIGVGIGTRLSALQTFIHLLSSNLHSRLVLAMVPPKLFQAIRAVGSRKAANGDCEPIEQAQSFFKIAWQDNNEEGRMIAVLLFFFFLSIVVIAIADEIDRRRANRLVGINEGAGSNKWALKHGGFVQLPFPTPMSSVRDSNSHPCSPPLSSSAETIIAQPKLKGIGQLADDIGKSTPTRTKISQKEESSATRQFDDIIKYDKFLKMLKKS